MSDFFNFEWGTDGDHLAQRLMTQLERNDTTLNNGVRGVLMGCVVVARGRKASPSSFFETLIGLKRHTNRSITDAIEDAWNVMNRQGEQTARTISTLTTLITPRHNNRTGISETLRYQLTLAYESLVDYWVVVTDMMTGFRSMTTKIFGVTETVGIGEYLHRGMTRSQLLKAFGHELVVDDEETT